MEKTLVLIKPDGVQRKLIGEIVSFYERKNLNIIALKMLTATKEIAENHYEEHKGRNYFDELITFITSSRLCAMVIEGNDAVTMVRKINGDKDPFKVDLGSIRGKFGGDKTQNLVHASDSVENAKREITIWFPELTE